jgi:hypothetical protein
MKRNILIILVVLLSTSGVKSQIGGSAIYSVLTLQSSAKTAALGMDFLPCFTEDVSAIINNPSTISERNHNDIGITYTSLFNGINQTSLAYSHSIDKIGNLALGVQYLNYGSFDMTEENGDVVGKFTAADYVFTLSWGKILDSNVFIGANLKPVFSQYESYNGFALAIDLAASYQSSDRTWALSLMARNMGKQIKKLANEDFSLPFDLQLSASKKLAHAPLTVYAAITDLHRWNLREDDPLNPRDEIDLNGEITKENKFVGIIDNAFRHLQIGVEFTPSKYFYIAAGYSWKRNREMQINDAFSIAGLSYGIGINYSRFRLSYSRNEYHRYGAPNYVSLLIKI